MDINIRRLSTYLAWTLPPYYMEPLGKLKFASFLSSATEEKISTDKFKDFVWFSNKDEEYFFNCLDYVLDFWDNWKDYIDSFINLLEEKYYKLKIPDDAKYSLLEIKKNNEEKNKNKDLIKENKNLPDKILIVEDNDWPKIWENFLKEYWIEWVKIVSSQWCTVTKWEEALKLNKHLNNNYNPLVFRVIDRDWFTDEQISIIKNHFETKYNDSLKYNFSILNLNELENIILQSPTYETTKFYEKVNNLKEYIENNFEEKLVTSFLKTAHQQLSQNKNIFDFNPAKNDFEEEKKTMKDEIKIDIIKRINWKDVINLLKKDFNISFDKIKFLKNLKKDFFPEELNDLLYDMKEFFL